MAASTSVTTLEQELKEIREAISCSIIAMHHRDFFTAADAVTKYLGRDAYAEALATEFESLPQAEKDCMKASRNYGKYGLFHQASRREVALALTVVGLELSQTFAATVANQLSEELADPEKAAKVTERFPDITAERIRNVRQPA